MIDGHRSPTLEPHPPAESVYVYAIVRRRDADVPQRPLTGVGSHPAPVRAVAEGALAALVSDVPQSWRAANRADLETHDRILSELIGEPLVPMRFGIVMGGDDAVRESLLQRHAGELAALLDHVDGRVQMSVKAYYRDEALLREVLARRPDLKRRADALEGTPLVATQNERIALGRDVAAAVEEQRALDERTLVEPLARAADDVHVDAGRSDRHAFTVQLLLEPTRRPELDAVVGRLTAEHGARFALRYVGPLPPYSFCDLALDTEAQPWA